MTTTDGNAMATGRPNSARDRQESLRKRTWDAIARTINKFRENPDYFFTESDIHAYLYYAIYSEHFEESKEGRRVYLVHREYPRNYRFVNRTILDDDVREPHPPDVHIGDRGNYDIAILDPEFVRSQSLDDLDNKDVRRAAARHRKSPDALRRELLFAIEFKYVIRNSDAFVRSVRADNKKLAWARGWGAQEAVNLVFCKVNDNRIVAALERAVRDADQGITSVLVRSYYEGDIKARPPKCVTNRPDLLRCKRIPVVHSGGL